jgi:hypothetical protein
MDCWRRNWERVKAGFKIYPLDLQCMVGFTLVADHGLLKLPLTLEKLQHLSLK